MKKIVALLVIAVMLCGCGIFESWYDDANYESLTNVISIL